MSELTTAACALCGESDYEVIRSFDSGVTVGECSACGFIYTPRQHANPGSVLDGDAEHDLEVILRPIVDGTVRHYRHGAYSAYLDRLEGLTPKRRLLDVGCAHGFFPAQAKARGWDCTAVEIQPTLAAFAARTHDIEVLSGSIQEVDLGSRKFDAVSFTDSLEYVPNPVEALRKVRATMDEDGVLLAKVPNADYFRLGMAASRAGVSFGETAFGPEQRVSHFTRDSIASAVAQAGFRDIDVGWFAPIHSTLWHRIVGLPLASEMPPVLDRGKRFLRNTLHAAGLAEFRLTGKNNGSQSLLLVARS
jgi:SAM-dependent methyltransferase